MFLPSEWHEQVAVQLTWPHVNTDWAPYLDDIVNMELRMVDAISKREKVVIATPEPEHVDCLLRQYLTTGQLDNICIYKVQTNDTWARDHSAITLKTKDNSPLLLDFQFNGWGNKFCADKDNEITRSLHSEGAFAGIYPANPELYNNNDFVLEGGAIESDGKGTVFTTSFCLLAPNRNQPLTKQQIEEELLRRLCCQRIIWIDHGQLIGDDTDGHIDTIVRPAPNDTLLYVKCYDTEDEQFADFDAMEKQLQTFRTIDGKPYRLLPLPMPRAIYDDGDRLPATYANFLVINGAVLVPTYGQPDLDRQALATINDAFPDREVIGIDAQVAVRQHGSLHCLTMQFPK